MKYIYVLVGLGVAVGLFSPMSHAQSPAPTATLLANGGPGPVTIAPGTPVLLSWTSSNTTACVPSGTWGFGISLPPNGSLSYGTLTDPGTYSFTITCSGLGGRSATSSVQISVQIVVTPVPTATLLANGGPGPVTIAPGTPVLLSWTTSNATACVASGTWAGTSLSSNGGSLTYGTLSAPGTYAFNISCSGPGGTSATSSVQIVVTPVPTATLLANGGPGPVTIAPGTPVLLTWTTTNATACVASGTWAGASLSPNGGSLTYGTLTAPGAYAFSMSCAGPGGASATSSVQIVVTSAAPQAPQITSPANGATVSGVVTLTATAPAAATLDYWVGGHSIVNSNQVLTSSLYSYGFDTTQMWDGPTQVVAVSRDSTGNVIGMSQPIALQILNGRQTQVKLLSPSSLSVQPVSGTISVQDSATDPRGVGAVVYFVDGKQVALNYTNGTSIADSIQLETTQFSNGIHNLFVQVVPNINYMDSGQASVQFTVNNASMPLELRLNFRQVFLTASGPPVQLAPRMVYTDGSEEPLSSATYSVDNSNIASVTSGTGLVTAGSQEGIANITVSSGGKSATIQAIVNNGAGFPHFTTSGRIVSTYTPGSSLWVRTPFFTSDLLVMTTPGLPGLLHNAGVNTVTTGFYFNPADNAPSTYPDLATWESIAGGALQQRIDAMKNDGFSIVGTGDDIQRTAAEMNNTLTNPWAPAAIAFTMNKLVQEGNVVSIEMQDEVGGTPVPQSYLQVMSLLDAGPRPAVSWPPAALQPPDVFAAWMGDPTMSDYSSLYWTYGSVWRLAFPWGGSLAQTKTNMDIAVVQEGAVLQMDKPKYLLVGACGPGYVKGVAGDQYHPGTADQMSVQGTYPEEVTAQIMYAGAMGFAGVRVYAYDGAAGSTDGLWSYQRQTAPIGTQGLQMGASPLSDNQGVTDRWRALSNAFNLVQNLEPYFLGKQINAIDLGADVATGARQSTTGGRMLIAVNMTDGVKSVNVDLSSYVSPAAPSITRYHLAGLLSTQEVVPNATSESVSMAPGEALIWIF